MDSAPARNIPTPAPDEASDAFLVSLVPSPPRRPSPHAREAIFDYQGRQRALLIIGAIFAVAGCGFAYVFAGDAFIDLYLAASARESTGVVISSEVATDVRINGRHPTRVTFSYRTADGERIGTSATLSEADADALQPGASVPLEIAAPGFARVKGLTFSMFGYHGLFALLLPLLGAALVAAAVRSNRREKRAFTDGVAAMATVTQSGLDMTTRINGRHPYLLEWEFVAEDGNTYRGKLTTMRWKHLDGLHDAKRIAVLYLREDPRVNTVYIP